MLVQVRRRSRSSEGRLARQVDGDDGDDDGDGGVDGDGDQSQQVSQDGSSEREAGKAV